MIDEITFCSLRKKAYVKEICFRKIQLTRTFYKERQKKVIRVLWERETCLKLISEHVYVYKYAHHNARKVVCRRCESAMSSIIFGTC